MSGVLMDCRSVTCSMAFFLWSISKRGPCQLKGMWIGTLACSDLLMWDVS